MRTQLKSFRDYADKESMKKIMTLFLFSLLCQMKLMAQDYTLDVPFTFRNEYFNSEIPKIFFEKYCQTHFYQKNGSETIPGTSYEVECANTGAFKKSCQAKCKGTLKTSTKDLREVEQMSDNSSSKTLSARFSVFPSFSDIRFNLENLVSLNKCIVDLNSVDPSKYKNYASNLACLKKQNLEDMEKDLKILFSKVALSPKEQNDMYKKYAVSLNQTVVDCLGIPGEIKENARRRCDSDRMQNTEGLVFNFNDRRKECRSMLRSKNRTLPPLTESKLIKCENFFTDARDVMKNDKLALETYLSCGEVIDECLEFAAVIGKEVNDEKRDSAKAIRDESSPKKVIAKEKKVNPK